MFDKSLIHNKNNIGPNTEPCGTPYMVYKIYFISKVEDIDELKLTY